MSPRRVDRNQHRVVQALRDIGATVQHLHTLGQGCPDILVGWAGRNWLMEIKSPGGKLTADEIRFAVGWQGQQAIVHSVEEAYAVIGVELCI